MPDRYAAFLSYARRYQPWVQILQYNLETCLHTAGRPGKVFLDDVDLASGRSWVDQLQAGLAKSDHLVLVASPEALASPRVTDEWEGFVARNRDWRTHSHIIQLVDTPLPPFLGPIHNLDFREADEETYRRELQKLVAGILGQAELRKLPTGIEIPKRPDSGLPPALRGRLVAWLAAPLSKRALRPAVAISLDLQASQLEGQPSPECAASAALVWAMRQEVAELAALRIIDRLADTFADTEPGWVDALKPIREDLLALNQRKPEDALLAFWLRQVATDHEQLTSHFQQSEPELDLLQRVYVELHLTAETEPVMVADRAVLAAPAELREILHLSPATESWVTRRWVVLGDPGAGKTTLLRHFAASLAREENRPWVPLFDSLPRLLREPEFVLAAVSRRMELLGYSGEDLVSLLDRLGKKGRVVFLLDGLDEVPREKRHEAEQLLRGLSERWPAAPLVVASRPIGYRRPGTDFRELALQPLDRGRRREFLARWLGRATRTRDDAGAEKALASLDSPELRELAGNPLYLTLMALLMEHDVEPSRNRTRLYDQVFELLLEGKHHWPEGEPIEAQAAVRAVLRRLAYDMTADNHDVESVTALEDRLRRPKMETLRRTLVAQWGKIRKFLDELAQRTGILGPHDGPDTDWRFWHRTFREALASERLEEEYRVRKGRAGVLKRARTITAEEDLSRWAEPFALLVGRVDEPDELVRALIEENRPLGLRALATAQSLQDDTIREVLALTEKWEERRKVYLRLPKLVGEPRRALALLDQLRQRTRSGNDLFFLDQAVQAVARSAPDHAREASELRARFYNHIPTPPEELFRSIVIPTGERVPLWREIPAGSFWMGSPAGEYRDDTEYPCHKVIIERPFRYGSVPVTHAQYDAFDPERMFEHWEGVTLEEFAYHPVTGVTWYEAASFCRWLSAAFPWARGARLPSEEEWEYACRAGTQSRFWSGDTEKDLARVGWYHVNSGNRTHRVGKKPANPWGLYDVHGNAWEWTLSSSKGRYKGREAGFTIDIATIVFDAAAFDASTPDGGGRVLRGGRFWDVAVWVRAAYRLFGDPAIGVVGQGFRVVLPAAP